MHDQLMFWMRINPLYTFDLWIRKFPAERSSEIEKRELPESQTERRTTTPQTIS